MRSHVGLERSPIFIGIESGATHTVALAADGNLSARARFETGPANLRLISDRQLLSHFRQIRSKMPGPNALCIAMAGARNSNDFRRIESAAAKIWPGVPCRATNDLESALAAAVQSSTPAGASVLILSGTGSCCFGRNKRGLTAKIGGWGHILGDKGSAFEIGLRALKAVVYYYDRDGLWPELGSRLLRSLQLNQPDDLITWVQRAAKPEIAALALEVFRAASARDRIARDVLKGAAHSLASDAAACAARLVTMGTPVNFIFSGSVLLKQPQFRARVIAELKQLWPNRMMSSLNQESVWGAVLLARQLSAKDEVCGARNLSNRTSDRVAPDPRMIFPLNSLERSPTEQRNPRSVGLDRMSIREAVTLMINEDRRIPLALLKERVAITQAVAAVSRILKSGGRLFYVGAGTSGRLGVLDASECPPTFHTDPEMVQGIMAGGERALWESVEGAEDDPQHGADAVKFRGVGRRDLLVGIAASGRTPFVWGALAAARERGAGTILLCFNPRLQIPKSQRPDLVIAPDVGPEILTGSTRLKAGTATKLILNIISTLAMVQLGKVEQNLMIDVKASNSKLRDRAVRIVEALTRVDRVAAQAALEKSAWNIRAASRHLRRR